MFGVDFETHSRNKDIVDSLNSVAYEKKEDYEDALLL